MPIEPFKYVGDEKRLELYETKQGKCSSCGLATPREEKIEAAAVTYFEITQAGPSKWRFFATLNGHKIIDKTLEEPARYTLV